MTSCDDSLHCFSSATCANVNSGLDLSVLFEYLIEKENFILENLYNEPRYSMNETLIDSHEICVSSFSRFVISDQIV